jgi:NTE family protein
LVGLVLEGGGARGAFQIGAYRALQEMGIQIEGIAGTSVGALNGAMIAQGEADLAYQLWWDIHPARVFKVNPREMEYFNNLAFSRENLPRLLKRLREIFSKRGLDITPLKELVNEVINEELIRESGLDFGLVVVSLNELRPMELFLEDIPRGKLADYLIASASLPGFKVDPVEGKRMIDGGLHDNMPVNLLVARGYTDIIVLRTHGPGRYRRVRQKGLNLTYISPSDDLGGILQFNSETARTNLQMGYFDAIKTLRQLKGFKYYLYPWDNDYFLDCFLTLDQEIVRDIGRAMGFKGGSHKRMLFEHIIPRYCELLGINRQLDYEDIGLRLLEEIAVRCGLERFNIYYLDEFISLVKAHYHSNVGNTKNTRRDLIKHNRVWSRDARKKLLDETVEPLFRGLVEEKPPKPPPLTGATEITEPRPLT